MGINFDITEGQTPLDEDEKQDLKIKSVQYRGELDEIEQKNIEDAILWTLNKSFTEAEVFSEAFIRLVHKKMFGKVWKWAGNFRKTNKNLGVDKWLIQGELRTLTDDAAYWLKNKTYEPDELVLRFKHRLVSIHCFPNGNGRHSRLIADIIIAHIFNKPVFTWGAANLSRQSDLRGEYLKAVKAADIGDFSLLIAFARK